MSESQNMRSPEEEYADFIERIKETDYEVDPKNVKEVVKKIPHHMREHCAAALLTAGDALKMATEELPFGHEMKDWQAKSVAQSLEQIAAVMNYLQEQGLEINGPPQPQPENE